MRFSGPILKETKLKIFLKSPDIFRDGKLLVHLHPMSLSVPSKACCFAAVHVAQLVGVLLRFAQMVGVLLRCVHFGLLHQIVCFLCWPLSIW